MPLDIKICGLKTEAALSAALAGGASHVGFIFYPRSPRNIEPAQAGRLREAARGKASAVAVTVDLGDEDLDRIVAAMDPDMLQLHGSESPERVRAVKARYGLPVIRALSIRTAADLEPSRQFRGIADRLMFDAKLADGVGLPGGNGICFDWRLLAGLDADVDFILSGGLGAANIGEAMRLAKPAGVDVSSGVESAPGVKEPALIAEFFRVIRAATEKTAA